MHSTCFLRQQGTVQLMATTAVAQLGDLRARAARRPSVHQAVDEVVRVYPTWGLVDFPPLLGKYRARLRDSLKHNEQLHQHVGSQLSCPTLPAGKALRCVVIGAKSPRYVERQLEDGLTHCTVVDHDLQRLTDLAFVLRPKFGNAVSLFRVDAHFALWCLFPHESLDVIVVAMPVPHSSRQASYRRLLTRDLFTLAHPCLRVRQSSSDGRGMVAFTDSAELATFAAEQLEESKLIVPWARKRTNVFSRWLPTESDGFAAPRPVKLSENGSAAPPSSLHILAAAKSDKTSELALSQVIEPFDFCRHYHNPLIKGPAEGAAAAP